MNEKIVGKLMQNGSQLPVTSLSAAGVTLGGEADNWPSGLVLEFDGNNVITRYRMNRVRQMSGWDHREYRLDLQLESGHLVCAGVRADALPAGTYWLRLRIADYII